jgi:hypothetical protein
VEIKNFQRSFQHATQYDRRDTRDIGDGIELPRTGGAVVAAAGSYRTLVLMNNAEIQRHVQKQTAHYRWQPRFHRLTQNLTPRPQNVKRLRQGIIDTIANPQIVGTSESAPCQHLCFGSFLVILSSSIAESAEPKRSEDATP